MEKIMINSSITTKYGFTLNGLKCKTVEFFDIVDKQTQVYILHVGLFMLQIIIILLVFQTFKRR